MAKGLNRGSNDSFHEFRGRLEDISEKKDKVIELGEGYTLDINTINETIDDISNNSEISDEAKKNMLNELRARLVEAQTKYEQDVENKFDEYEKETDEIYREIDVKIEIIEKTKAEIEKKSNLANLGKQDFGTSNLDNDKNTLREIIEERTKIESAKRDMLNKQRVANLRSKL